MQGVRDLQGVQDLLQHIYKQGLQSDSQRSSPEPRPALPLEQHSLDMLRSNPGILQRCRSSLRRRVVDVFNASAPPAQRVSPDSLSDGMASLVVAALSDVEQQGTAVGVGKGGTPANAAEVDAGLDIGPGRRQADGEQIRTLEVSTASHSGTPMTEQRTPDVDLSSLLTIQSVKPTSTAESEAQDNAADEAAGAAISHSDAGMSYTVQQLEDVPGDADEMAQMYEHMQKQMIEMQVRAG
jgi:hypothetical protein